MITNEKTNWYFSSAFLVKANWSPNLQAVLWGISNRDLKILTPKQCHEFRPPDLMTVSLDESTMKKEWKQQLIGLIRLVYQGRKNAAGPDESISWLRHIKQNLKAFCRKVTALWLNDEVWGNIEFTDIFVRIAHEEKSHWILKCNLVWLYEGQTSNSQW